jgi:hypothetical protein
MSGFFSEDNDYEDRTGALLAHVADLLLRDSPDWKTLERLEAALEPPKKPAYEYFKKSIPPTDRTVTLNEYGSYTMGSGISPSSGSAMRAVEIAYEDKLRDMLSSQMKTDVFKRLYSGEPMWTDPGEVGEVRGYDARAITKAAEPITKEDLLRAIRKIRPDDDDEGLALTGV